MGNTVSLVYLSLSLQAVLCWLPRRSSSQFVVDDPPWPADPSAFTYIYCRSPQQPTTYLTMTFKLCDVQFLSESFFFHCILLASIKLVLFIESVQPNQIFEWIILLTWLFSINLINRFQFLRKSLKLVIFSELIEPVLFSLFFSMNWCNRFQLLGKSAFQVRKF